MNTSKARSYSPHRRWASTGVSSCFAQNIPWAAIWQIGMKFLTKRGRTRQKKRKEIKKNRRSPTCFPSSIYPFCWVWLVWRGNTWPHYLLYQKNLEDPWPSIMIPDFAAYLFWCVEVLICWGVEVVCHPRAYPESGVFTCLRCAFIGLHTWMDVRRCFRATTTTAYRPLPTELVATNPSVCR